MKKFTVKINEQNGGYIVEAHDNASFDIVWLSEKCWFSTGREVTITNENGESRIYIKE
jgi:hypothetical protein